MNSRFGIPMTAEQYASEWEENSKFFSANRYYEWMASVVDQSSTVIEVGCGSGGGTLALAKNAMKVIAVEINPTLAAAAAKFLSENAFPTDRKSVV